MDSIKTSVLFETAAHHDDRKTFPHEFDVHDTGQQIHAGDRAFSSQGNCLGIGIQASDGRTKYTHIDYLFLRKRCDLEQ